MAAGTDMTSLVKAVTDLLEITKDARECAEAKDFVKLAQAIERRDRLIETLRSTGELSVLPPGSRSEVLELLERAHQIDSDIRRALECEMASDNEAMADAATKAKVLSAYERIVPRPPRFDTQK